MHNDRVHLRNLVDIIDGTAPAKKTINESKKSLVESKKSKALNEARNIAELIESNELSEEQLSELLAGLGALGRAAAQKVGGAAQKVGQAVGTGAKAAGQAVGSAAQRVGAAAQQAGGAISGAAQRGVDAATAAAQKVGGAAQQAGAAVKDIYQSGEQKAAIKSTLQTVNGIQNAVASMPGLEALASKGDKVTLGQIKAALQKLSAAE